MSSSFKMNTQFIKSVIEDLNNRSYESNKIGVILDN